VGRKYRLPHLPPSRQGRNEGMKEKIAPCFRQHIPSLTGRQDELCRIFSTPILCLTAQRP
ncbi:MAG: hypothetical protein LBB73_09655, partial [Dysgonamonadaceae bacterium]|nr:hypothetical protein [Dysgonamonadaceae bacterium]